MRVSIVVCTAYAPEACVPTLHSIMSAPAPPGWTSELLIVDNSAVSRCERFELPQLGDSHDVRYLHVPEPGKSRALNAAISASTGDVLLFTDDDTRVPAGWIAQMAGPIAEGECGGVAGGVAIAPHLIRPWMTPRLRQLMAETTWLEPMPEPECLVGANMAISRRVFDDLQGFDTELGPGALGFNEEGLYALRMRAAGHKILGVFTDPVEHHFRADRLLRRRLLSTAYRQALSDAYVALHWHHWSLPRARAKWWVRKARLAIWRLCHAGEMLRTEGVRWDEAHLTMRVADAWFHVRNEGVASKYDGPCAEARRKQ